MPRRPASSPKPKIKPIAEIEWQVQTLAGTFHIVTKDTHRRWIGRGYSLANARLICREHNAALTAKERGA